MRRLVQGVFCAGWIVVYAAGCSGRFHRPEPYDPFASARQTPAGKDRAGTDRAGTDYPRLVPPGPDIEVTQAGRDIYPRRTVPDRDQTDSEIPPLRQRNSAPDQFEAAAPSRPASRPTTRKLLDHAPDYSWIQGRLEYSNLGGGIWRVRYAPLSADDEHGGSVILESPPDLQQFAVGDVVYVEGQVMPNSARGALPNPVYRATIVDHVGD